MRVPLIVTSALFAAGAFLATTAPLSAANQIVWVESGGFTPANSSVNVGDHVTFVVRDERPHQIAKSAGPDAGELKPAVLERHNAAVMLLFTDPGDYTYVDRLGRADRTFRVTVRAKK